MFFQNKLESLLANLNNFSLKYSTLWDEPSMRLSVVNEGMCCVVGDEFGGQSMKYYRAKVLHVIGSNLVVSLIDFAQILQVPVQNARLVSCIFITGCLRVFQNIFLRLV